LASIHLVNLSTATRRCVKPPGDVFNGPTMSRPQMANGQLRGMVLRAAAEVCICLEKRWQPLHNFASNSVSCMASKIRGRMLWPLRPWKMHDVRTLLYVFLSIALALLPARCSSSIFLTCYACTTHCWWGCTLARDAGVA
jgi:hypothetical protein